MRFTCYNHQVFRGIMKSFIVLLILLLVSGFAFGAVACNDGEAVVPTPASSPEPASPTPIAIDWAAIGTRISQLATDNGLTIYEVKQLTDDIVEVSVEGECMDFASLVDAEPEFVLQGKPQLDLRGICTMWFRVLPSP
jgi:hypothetical protein